MRVLAVDENGYGPVLGPLVITGILFRADLKREEVPQESSWEKNGVDVESKKLFSAKSSARKIAVSLLRSLTEDFKKLYIFPSRSLERCERKERKFCLSEKDFLTRLVREPSGDREAYGLQVEGVFVRVVCPGDFNSELSRWKNKLQVLFREFKFLIENAVPPPDVILADSISGTRNYHRVFKDYISGVIPHGDGIYEATLHLKSRELKCFFAVKGDERFFPVALASAVGKLMREVAMDAFNEGLADEGWSGKRVSGYRDVVTRKACLFLRKRGLDEKCIFRER